MANDMSRLRDAVMNNDLASAVRDLLALAKGPARRFQTEVILHGARLRQLGSDERMGVSSPDEVRRERTRIALALLELVDEMERVGAVVAETKPADEPATGEPAKREPAVFLSYSWADQVVADEIEAAFTAEGVYLARDVRDAPYRQDLPAFMQRLGRARHVVMLVSDTYLKSRNCMYEVLEFLAHGGFEARALPVVLPNATGIFDAARSLEYLEFWDRRAREVDAALRGMHSLEHTRRVQEELDHCSRIRAAMDGFLASVNRMNTLSLEAHRAAGYRNLLAAARGAESASSP